MILFSVKIKNIKSYLVCLAVLFQYTMNSQAILISIGGTVNVNGGEIFYDAGGTAGNDGNVNRTITLCPSAAGKNVCVDFTMFNTFYNVSSLSYAYGDSLCLFDGASITSNKIATLSGNYGASWNNGTTPTPVGIGTSSGLSAVTAPGIFCSTNTTGCITASFYNIDATQSPGWSANVSTYTPLGTPGCTVNLATTANTVCAGNTITLTATGNIVSSSLNNNFNSSTVGSGWSGTSAATFQSNACGKPSLDGSIYLWMANASCPRILASNGINVSSGGTLSFEYRSPDNNSDPSPCEAPDINGSTPEAVFIQYSINSGTTWNNMKVMFPNNIQSPSLTGDNYLGCGYEVKKWSKIVVPIPTAAQTTNTQFRWIMPVCTSASTDNWGLDNVIIASPRTYTLTIKDLTNNITLLTSTVSPISVSQTPTVTTVYQASISDGTTTCTNNQTVTVNSGGSTVTSFSYANSYCNSAAIQTPTTAVGFTTGGTFSASPAGLSLNASTGQINIGASTTGTYLVTYTVSSLGCGVAATSSSSVIIVPTPTISVNSSTICSGGSATLTANGAASYTWSPTATLSSATGSTVVSAPSSNTNYTVVGSNGTCTNSATSSVTIGAGITITSNPASICAGNNTILTASGATSYTWSPSATLSSAIGTTVVATPTVNTTYTITGVTGVCSGTTTVLVTVNNLPTITVNSPTICSGGSAVLNSGGATTYSWSAGLSSTSGTTVTASPLTTTIYTVTGTTGGCSSTETSTVTILPTPTLSTTNYTTCSGGSVTLTVSGASSYTWSPSASLSSANGSVVVASPVSSTNYSVVGSNGTCTSSVTSSVTVGANLSLTSSSSTICAGSSTTLSVNGASSYTWSPALTLNTSNGSSVVATPSINTTYTINGTNATCSGSTTVNVSIVNTPTITVNSLTICAGSSGILTAGGALTYTWTNGSTLSSINGVSVSANPTSTTIYTVTGSNGCLSSNTSTVTIISSPTIAVNNPTICPGSSVIITATGATTFSWSNGASSPTISVTPNTATNYTVIGTTNGCTSSTVSSVVMNAVPIVTVNSPTLCIGSSVTLSANGATSYSWSNGATTQTISVSPIIASNYTVTGTSNGCSSSALSSVSVVSFPTVTVNSPTLCSGSSVVLIASGAASYSWSNGATTASISVSPNSNASYTVAGSNSGCSNYTISNVSVTSTPTITLSPDIIITKGSNTQLNVISTSTIYSWSPATALSCITCSNPIASPIVTTQYCLTSSNGSCASTSCVLVSIEPTCYSNVDYTTPNAFSPNGDGVNDEFCLKGWGECATTFYIAIYDRWGEKVFDSEDPDFCWDGKYLGVVLNTAVFVYYIKAEMINAVSITKKGNITLLK